MMKRILLSVALATVTLASMADLPFRQHRYDSFRATPVNNESIIFYGNSITNMNEWWECFGCDHRILNRGNSGGYTQELIDNIESLTIGHPAKVFVGIGTNDLGTEGLDSPEYVAGNIRKLIDLFNEQSPETEVYIQSILPSENGHRTNERAMATNALIKAECEKGGATYVDLFEPMMGICSHEISYDGLHLTAKGYKIWCDIIAPLVGVECSYPDEFEENACGITWNSWGMRSTHWSVQEVKEDDILFIGDEMIHGGEWHELLNSDKVKNRGTGWGYGGVDMDQWAKYIESILGTNPDRKTAPSTICLYMGVPNANSWTTPETSRDQYTAIVDAIRKYAPAEKTRIILMALIPKAIKSVNRGRVEPFNAMLQEMAKDLENVEYADIYTPLLKNGVADPDQITENYVYARGYNTIARTMAEILGAGTKAMSAEEFEEHYAKLNPNSSVAPISTERAPSATFDLNGRPISPDAEKPAGIYIIDGKKVLVK